jgi:putative alpha-1,2-mannosidase
MSLNGQPWTKPWLSRETLQQGGTIGFTMGAAPNKAWGSAKADRPFSMTATH